MATNPRNQEPDEDDFEALLNQHLPTASPKQKGELLDATVVAIVDDEVIVSFGSKDECPIPFSEFLDPKGELTVRVGDGVRVLLTGWTDDGEPQVSHKAARGAAANQMLREAAERGVPVRGVVSRVAGSGVIVDVGVPAFMPASHCDTMRIPDLSSLIGQEVEAYVLEYDDTRNRAVLSRRKLLAERQDAERQKFLSGVQPGDVLKGVVREVLDFGLFVRIGAVEGLVPRSELTYDRGVSPSDLFKAGDAIEVKVLELAADTGKVTLSRKRVGEDPWLTIGEHYPVGSTVTGRVVTVQEFGAFVQLREGITGLIHAENISWEKGRKSAKDKFQPGDTVTCQVVEIDQERKRLGLSLKHLARDPWTDTASKYPVGSRHKGTVKQLRDFGAIIQLDEFTDGLLHVGDLSWTERPKHPGEVVSEGQEVEVVILNLDAAKRRLSLGLKQLTGSPYEQFVAANPVGSVATGRVTRIERFGAFVELLPGLEGLIHISELDTERVDTPERVVRIGEEVSVKVLGFEAGKKRISLSRKQAIDDLERENIRQYTRKADEKSGTGLSLGDMLKKAMEKKRD